MRYQILYYFLKPHRLLYGGILIVTLCASVLESLSVVSVFPLFSSVLSDSGEEVGGILKIINSMAGISPFSDPVVAASVLILVVWVLRTVFTLLREGLTAYATGKVLYEVRGRVMERYTGAHYQLFLDRKQGTLMYDAMGAPSGAASSLRVVAQMVAECLRLVAIIILLILVNPFITLALGILGLAYFGVVYYISRRVSYYIGQGKVKSLTEQTIVVNEMFSGILQIITFGTVKAWLRKFQRENLTYCKLFVKDQIWLATPKRLMEFTSIALMLGIILTLRSFSPDTFSATLPKLGVFAMALVQLMPAMTLLGRERMELMTIFPDAERAYDALTGPVPQRRDGSKAFQSYEKSITFEDVHFAHKDREPLFNGVDLTFEKGKVTAVVGPSGAGKTTMINLILGLFEASEGRITVDGVPLQEYRLESWLGNIGFVSQEAFISHSTVADNITFARNGHSMESIIKAAKIANAHGFISELPQGYDTVVGDRGMKLSGGQQQRISIARAVLNEPEILIFDEATSSLDSDSEKLVQEAMDIASKDRTVIIIAHRLSTVRHADKIIVLDGGRVVEQGIHEELLSRNGHYSRIVASSR